MFSKPLAFVVLALGCLTAAAGGAYVATRHTMSDPTGRPAAAAPAALASSPSSQAAVPTQAVAETESAVTSAKPEHTPGEANPAQPAATVAPVPTSVTAEAPPAEPVPAPRPAARTTTASKATSAGKQATQPSHGPAATPHQAQRTAPVTAANGSAAPPDATTPPAAAATPPAKPGEAIKPVEDPLPEPPRSPQFEELILPAASVIGLQVETTLSSERARVEDRVDARVSRDVMSSGRVAIPAGSRVIGSVTTVERGGKVKDQARLGIRFHTLVLADGSQVPLHTDAVYRVGEEPSNGSTKKIGGAAIGGAIIGAILGGGKGAAIGGATGAAGGTAAVMAGDRSAATLRQGEYLNVKLAAPATITVERRE